MTRKPPEGKTLDELVRDLHSPESGKRYWAIEYLREHGEAAVEPLIQFLQGPPDSEWYLAAKALGELGDPRAVRVLTELYLRDTSRVAGMPHHAAGEALKRIGQADLQLLLEALHSEDSYVRQEAAGLVGDLRVTDASDDLMAVAPTTVAAVRALGQIRVLAALPLLLGLLSDSREQYMRAAAASSLGQIGDEAATDGLVQATKDQDEGVRAAAITALGDVKSSSAAPVLQKLLSEEAPTVRSAALTALAKIDPEGSIELLIRATEDVDPGVRKSAWTALGSYEASDVRDRVQGMREGRLARLPEILEERIVASAMIIQREALDVLELRTEPGLFELWDAIPGEGSEPSDDETLRDVLERVLHSTPEVVVTCGNWSSMTSGTWTMFAVRLPNIAILCAEYDEADDLYLLAGWRPVTAERGLDEAFLSACAHFADEFFSGAEDVPELNVPVRLLEEGIRRCLSANPAFRETVLERLVVAGNSPDDAELASRFIGLLGLR